MRHEGRRAHESGVLALLSTDGDRPSHWLCVGQALKHAVLVARNAGVWAAYHNHPIELPHLRLRLRDAAGVAGYPQVLLRLGYGYERPPTPRRGIDEVLLRP